jgi:hypothetical protein
VIPPFQSNRSADSRMNGPGSAESRQHEMVIACTSSHQEVRVGLISPIFITRR